MKLNQFNLLLFCIFLALFIVSIRADEKYEKIESVMKKTGSNLVKLSAKSVNEFIKQDRSYNTLILFISTNPKHGCQICHYLQNMAKIVADAYHNEPNTKELVFLYMDAAHSYDAFVDLQIARLPLFVLLPANKQFSMDDDRTYAIRGEESLDPQSLANWINEKTGIEIKIPASKMKTYAIIGAIALGIFFVINILRFKRSGGAKWRSPMFWYGLVMCELIVVFGGTVFNAIRGVPWYNTNFFTNKIEWIAGDMRSQFGLEGYFIAVLTLVCSISFILMSTVPRTIKNGWLQRFSVLFFMALFAFLFNVLMDYFLEKVPYYPFRDYFIRVNLKNIFN